MRRIAMAAMMMAVLVPLPAAADFYTGKEIKKFCATKSPIMLGYLAGWTDKWERDTNMLAAGYDAQKTAVGKRIILPQLQKATEGICVPYGASLGQMFDILCKYVADHPDKLELGSTALIAASVGDAWQCDANE
jgi:hypothetical protein